MDFKQSVRNAGFKSQAHFARYNKISANAVSKWQRPEGKIPQWAKNQLDTLVGIKALGIEKGKMK